MERTVSPSAELQASNFVARVPALALAGAELMLSKVTREKGALPKQFVETALEAKWSRAILVLSLVLLHS